MEKLGSVLDLDSWLACVHVERKGGRYSSGQTWVWHKTCPGPRDEPVQQGQGSVWGRKDVKLL